MHPLFEVGPLDDGVFGGLPAFPQPEKRGDKINRAQDSGGPAGGGHAKVFAADGAEDRAEGKADAEGHADQTHFGGAVFRRGDVRDVSLGHGDVRAANAGKQAREEHHRQGRRGVGKAGADGENDIGKAGATSAGQQDGPPPNPVGKPAPDGREDKLHQGIRADDRADDKAAGVEAVAVNGNQGQDQAEADQVDCHG